VRSAISFAKSATIRESVSAKNVNAKSGRRQRGQPIVLDAAVFVESRALEGRWEVCHLLQGKRQ